jgi:hypothetical protein
MTRENNLVQAGKTREGWPLLTVETEVDGDSKSTNERGSSLVGSLDSSCRYKRFLFCLAALVGLEQNIFSLAVHYFDSCISIDQQAGQTVVLGRLSLSIFLWTKPSGHLALYSEEYSVKHNVLAKKRITYDDENLQNFPLIFHKYLVIR